MKDVANSAGVQFVIMILAVMAGIVAVKAAATYLPQGGVFGALKRVVMAV